MKTIYLILYIITLFIITGCTHKIPAVLTYEQNLSLHVNYIVPLHVEQENYESRYFMPWSISKIYVSKDIAEWANNAYKKEHKYFAENLVFWDINELESIIDNTNFHNYNLDTHFAITVENTQTRNLPTHKPFFRNPAEAGEGFPFDYMQNSLLHINTPIFISHYSSDGAWAFVQSPVSIGWLPTQSFVLLNSKQRVDLIDTKKIVITNKNNPIYDFKQQYLLHVKLGSIFPYTNEDENFFYSYIYTRFGKQIQVRISKHNAHLMPLEFNQTNVLHVSNELLGEKYGWGGYLNNRDCSSMTKDYFAPFGIWLPRNSGAQKNAGEYLSLAGLSNKEKEEMILKNGIAFLSLIYLRGHIMLYAGEFEDKAMIMHNMWGVKTHTNGEEGRHIVGKAVISDLYIGKNLDNVEDKSLLISRVDGIVIKPNVPPFQINKFVNVYPSIISLKDNELLFDDNSTLLYSDYTDKTFEQMIDNPSIKDTLSLNYSAFKEIQAPKLNEDAGRFRNQELVKKLYGANENSIRENLVKLIWVDGTTLLFNKKQNAASQLQKVIDELNTLPQMYQKYITNIAGTFNYRYIKDTKRLSTHSFGIAIDLNVKESRYWKWDKEYKYSNNFPKEIIDIFEKYGFIWGGRWYHYDTMHFEYRPELFTSTD